MHQRSKAEVQRSVVARLLMYRKPPALRAGMRIGIVAPSSPFSDSAAIARASTVLGQMGLDVVMAPHASDANGHLAGFDHDRARDLVDMLTRPDVHAVMCLRGGWGALRTVLAISAADAERLRRSTPKVFIGFSDATVIHGYLNRLGWITFYGPMMATLGQSSRSTISALKACVMDGLRVSVQSSRDDGTVVSIVSGAATGRLVGGCLQLVCLMTGSPWECAFAGNILLLEDVDSEVADVESRLCHLLAGGWLKQCAGIVVGECVRCVLSATVDQDRGADRRH